MRTEKIIDLERIKSKACFFVSNSNLYNFLKKENILKKNHKGAFYRLFIDNFRVYIMSKNNIAILHDNIDDIRIRRKLIGIEIDILPLKQWYILNKTKYSSIFTITDDGINNLLIRSDYNFIVGTSCSFKEFENYNTDDCFYSYALKRLQNYKEENNIYN